jgi:hypothetical protein
MSEDARKRLKVSLEKNSLLAPITWNRVSGNIVGGHQRIKALDAIARGKDYTLRVAAVEMTEVEEKQANLALNSERIQGHWAADQLGDMLRDETLDLDAAGFDATDVYVLLGEESKDTVLTEIANRVQQMHDIADATQGTKAKDDENANNLDFFMVFVWKNSKECQAFRDAHPELLEPVRINGVSVETARYANGRALEALIPTKAAEPEPDRIVRVKKKTAAATEIPAGST